MEKKTQAALVLFKFTEVNQTTHYILTNFFQQPAR